MKDVRDFLDRYEFFWKYYFLIFSLHNGDHNPMLTIRKKFEAIEETLEQEINKSLENQLHALQQKHPLQKIKTFFCSKTSRFYRILKIKKHQLFQKILPLQLPSFSFGYEEVISLLVLLGLIGIIVIGSLLNPSAPQFLITFC